MGDISTAFQESLRNFNANKTPASNTGGIGASISNLFGAGSSNAAGSSASAGGTGAMDSLLGGVRSATQNISSTLGLSTRETPEPEFCGLTSWQRFIGFCATFAMASFCFMVALFSLPLMVISPPKFVTPFTLGSLLAICSFALIKGPRAYLKDCLSRERIAWTIMYFTSLGLTLYFSLLLHSYLLTIVAVVIQMFTLVRFFGSYAPSMRKLFFNVVLQCFLVAPSLSMLSMFGGGGGGVALPV
ncbi:protein transport protein sft2 [Chytriomyces hyalinus]|nr:protein transport protein sft2 [Chytriomyces hyalinus]